MDAPHRAKVVAAAAALHLLITHALAPGPLEWWSNTVAAGLGLVYWWCKCTLGFPVFSAGLLVAQGLWVYALVWERNVWAAAGLLSSTGLRAAARCWRDYTFNFNNPRKLGLKEAPYPSSAVYKLFFGSRPDPPAPNHGRSRPVLPMTRPPKKLVAIVNPAAGRGKGTTAWNDAQKVFDDRGIAVDVRMTQSVGDGTRIARSLPDDVEAVVVVGGDGTLSEVLNGLLAAREPGEANNLPPLGCIPGGTCNNFCYDLGIQSATDAAIRIATGCIAEIDAARVEHNSKVTYSLNTIAWGAGLQAVQFAEKVAFLGPAKFNVGGLVAILLAFFFGTGCAKVSATATEKSGRTVKLEGMYVFGMSMLCQRAGNSFRFGPGAKLDNGVVETVLLRRTSILRTIELFDEVKRNGAHVYAYDGEMLQWTSMTFDCDTVTPMSIDGEDTGTTPMSMTCVQRCFKVFV